MISLNRVVYALFGKSFGCVFRDQSRSNVSCVRMENNCESVLQQCIDRMYLIFGLFACTTFFQCRRIKVFVFVFVLVFAKFFAERTFIFVPNVWMLDHRCTKHNTTITTIWCRPQHLKYYQCENTFHRWNELNEYSRSIYLYFGFRSTVRMRNQITAFEFR